MRFLITAHITIKTLFFSLYQNYMLTQLLKPAKISSAFDSLEALLQVGFGLGQLSSVSQSLSL